MCLREFLFQSYSPLVVYLNQVTIGSVEIVGYSYLHHIVRVNENHANTCEVISNLMKCKLHFHVVLSCV